MSRRRQAERLRARRDEAEAAAIWWVCLEEYPDEGSTCVTAPDAESARRRGREMLCEDDETPIRVRRVTEADVLDLQDEIAKAHERAKEAEGERDRACERAGDLASRLTRAEDAIRCNRGIVEQMRTDRIRLEARLQSEMRSARAWRELALEVAQ